MRLLDQIVGAAPEISATDALGVRRRLTGVGGKAEALAACPVRYVLDAEVSAQCSDLVTSQTGLFDPASELLQLPAGTFWLEWLRGQRAGERRSRLGVLVEAGEGGRSGQLTGYWENGDGIADLTVLSVAFDLDAPIALLPLAPEAVRIRHGTLPHLSAIFDHSLGFLDPTWAAYLQAMGEQAKARKVRELAEAAWFNLPMVLAFCAMLNSRVLLEQQPSRLEPLNRARARRGKRALLDHLEVRMALNAYGSSGGSAGHGTGRHRARPRLHHVRGHFVHRTGKTFWRSPHLRGDSDHAVLTKTIEIVPGTARQAG